MSNIFVTGINTEVGKTVASAILVEALGADYWKPIQCGELKYTDSMKVKNWISHSNTLIHPESVRLKAAESPHFSAKLETRSIQLKDIQIPKTKKHLIIEGAGGLCVPLNSYDFLIDLFPKDIPIVLVSKNELGSINATLLSIYYLKGEGFRNIAVLFNGHSKPSTESIIAQKTHVTILGRIERAKNIDTNFIQYQSKKLIINVNKFIHAK